MEAIFASNKYTTKGEALMAETEYLNDLLKLHGEERRTAEQFQSRMTNLHRPAQKRKPWFTEVEEKGITEVSVISFCLLHFGFFFPVLLVVFYLLFLFHFLFCFAFSFSFSFCFCFSFFFFLYFFFVFFLYL